jgi:hypothetical protein
MRDLFLISRLYDSAAALDVATRLGDRGLDFGDPVWLSGRPYERLLPIVDEGLTSARFALVVLTHEFLTSCPDRSELDGLAKRRRVVSVLHGVDETDVAEYSPRLAMAAVPGSLIGRLERLVRSDRGRGG